MSELPQDIWVGRCNRHFQIWRDSDKACIPINRTQYTDKAKAEAEIQLKDKRIAELEGALMEIEIGVGFKGATFYQLTV